MSDKKQIGKILLRQKALTPEQLDKALDDQRTGRLASRLTEDGTISDLAALKALSEQHGIPGIDLTQICLRLDDLDLLPREIAEKHLILPVLVRDDRLFVAMANPREKNVLDELEFVTGKRVYPYVALENVLLRVIQEAYALRARGEDFFIGPNCPPEAQTHLVTEQPAAFGSAPPGALELRAPSAAPPMRQEPLTAPGVVVDDRVEAYSHSDDVGEEGFGELSKELSVVTDLPAEPSGIDPAATKTILVVDDESEIRKMVSRLLVQRGYRALEADKGLLALKLVKEQVPDLIILDAMVPEVHGFDIARRIKGSKRYGHIPIIMVSAVYRGWRYAEDLRESCGVDHYLEKPFRIAELMQAVERSLAKDETAGEASDRDKELNAEAEAALNAGVEAYKTGRLDEAVMHLKRGISIDPLAYRLHFHLGLLQGKRGQVYEAISELETAVEINSRHFPAVKNLAVLYQKAGFRNKATEMWQRALTLAPDDETRQTIKDHLLNLL